MERLDKFLCGGGAGTRSQVKELLKAGRVTVDARWSGTRDERWTRRHRKSAWTALPWEESGGWW